MSISDRGRKSSPAKRDEEDEDVKLEPDQLVSAEPCAPLPFMCHCVLNCPACGKDIVISARQ